MISIKVLYLFIGVSIVAQGTLQKILFSSSLREISVLKVFIYKIGLFRNELNSPCVGHVVDLPSTNITKAKNTVRVRKPDIRTILLMCKFKNAFVSCSDSYMSL